MQAWTREQIGERPGTPVMSAREFEMARGGCSYNLCPAGCPSLRQGSGGNRAAGCFKSCRAALALLLAAKPPRPTGMPIACDRRQRRYRDLNALIDEGANADRQLGQNHPDGAAVFLCSAIGEVAQLDAGAGVGSAQCGMEFPSCRWRAPSVDRKPSRRFSMSVRSRARWMPAS